VYDVCCRLVRIRCTVLIVCVLLVTTVCFQACYQGHLGCVALLLDAGCNVFLLDQYGNAPCDIFCDQVSRELSVEVRLLIAQHKAAIAAAVNTAAAGNTAAAAAAAGKPNSNLHPDSSSQTSTTPCSPVAGGQQHRGFCRAHGGHGGSAIGSSSEPCVCALRKKPSASSSTTNNRWAGADRYRQRPKRQWQVTDRYSRSNGSSKVAVLEAAAAAADGSTSLSSSSARISSGCGAAAGVIDLHAAAREGAVLVMKQALEEGVCVNTRDCNGMTALMWAAQCGR
jgi:hypothetical protein